jgi:DNA repair protein RecO (recombination protein O)
MPQLQKETAAIVIDCHDHGESDKIVTFFCAEGGRLSGIAKGAKRSKKRFVNKLELFSYLQLTYSLPRINSLAFIAAAELYSPFLKLRQNIELYNAATVIREFVLIGTSERESDNRIFELLLWSLQSLEDRRSPGVIIVIFLIRFFEYIGYKPNLLHCHQCGERIEIQKKYGFNYSAGSLACDSCSRQNIQAIVPLCLGTIKLLLSSQDLPLERLHRLQFSARPLKESLDMLHRYGRQLFQRDFHSWDAFIKED